MWTRLGGRLSKSVDTNMVWIDLAGIGVSAHEFDKLGAAKGLFLSGSRIIIHYQISQTAIERLGEAFVAAVELGKNSLGSAIDRTCVNTRSYGNT